ncbi:MAG: 50S ribosomal protein L15 [Mycoplasmoidaceae bacterium]|nr:50S ribosomal protein L15 [Mycoplasmoidaceae bacterium]
MKLNELKYTKGSRNHKTKTYGRGFGSGIGKTSGKGTKGQKSRKSGKVRLGFEGGQTPLYRKIPKVGFNNYNFKKNFETVSINQIEKLDNASPITKEVLAKNRLISSKDALVKLIGANKDAKLSKAYEIVVDKATAGVIKLVENAGGKITFTK